MRHTVLTLLLCAATTAALAVPAKRVKKLLTLQDGTQVESVLAGDEYDHFYLAPDGTRYTASGTPYAAQPARAIRRTKATARRRAKWGAQKNPISGTRRGIVILVNFQDKQMTNTQAEFNDFFNQVGYNRYGMTGSVHDYFYKCSYGQFDLQFDVVGPVTVSHDMAYYGQNDANDQDLRPATMVCEAVRLADALGVDFSQYDWDNDGQVDQVYVIYAGNGEAQDGGANTIWPHEFDLTSSESFGDGTGAITTDGVTIDTYATSCECRGATSTTIDGIGTACHEFSHCMAIPDFYDTGEKNYGMDCWDLMDYGCYNGPSGQGESPWEYTSYERMYCGWLTPTELREGATIDSMQPLETTPEAYIIYNEGNRNEYYLLENRQGIDFDRYGYGHGMVVLHVDFDAKAWISNTPNTLATRQRMTIIPADNSWTSVSYGASNAAADPFPGTNHKTELTNTSRPAAKVYSKNTDGKLYMNKPITDIAETDAGLISFKFMGGYKLHTPEVRTDSITADAFTATWDPVPEATHYELMLTEDGNEAPASVCFEEDFAGFQTGGTADGTADVSADIDDYTHQTGWEGLKIYTTADKGAKVGSSNSKGYLTTPTIAARAGYVNVELHLTPYGADKPHIALTLDQSDAPAAVFDILSDTTVTTQLLVSDDFRLTLEPTQTTKQRVYITAFNVYTAAPAKVKSTQTYTTDSTSYTFTGLNPEHAYTYTVRALSDEYTSEWSEPVCVTLATVGINNSKLKMQNGAAYDLQGRRVMHPTHGLYIINGRKAAIK